MPGLTTKYLIESGTRFDGVMMFGSEMVSDQVFEEIKTAAINIWCKYDNEHGYVTEKLARIQDLENTGDNWSYIVAMFDSNNQAKLINMVSPATAAIILAQRNGYQADYQIY